MLVSEGKLERPQLDRALELQFMTGGRLGTNLLELSAIREAPLLETLGRFRKTKTVAGHDLIGIPAEVLRLVPPKIIHRHQVLPIEHTGNRLVLASMNPGDPFVEDEIGLLTSCLVRTVIALEIRIHAAMAVYYQVPLQPRVLGLLRRLAGHGKTSRGQVAEPPAAEAKPEPPPKSKGSLPPPPKPARRPVEEPPIEEPPAEEPPIEEPPVEEPSVEEPPIEEPPVGRPDFIELDTDELTLIYGRKVEEVDEYAETVSLDPAWLDPSILEPSPAPPAPPVAPVAVVGTTVLPVLQASDPDERLMEAAAAFQESDIRDEIGDVLLGYCEPFFRRRALFIQRKDHIVGWRGEGEGVETKKMRSVEIDRQEPSIFLGLTERSSLWMAPLPPLPANRRITTALGGDAPQACLVLPVVLRKRVVCFLYGDNGDDGVAKAPMSELRRLVAKAGLAFEVYILKNKIRTL